MKTENNETITHNPFLSIWFHPKLTVRRLIDYSMYSKKWLLLIILAGILEGLNRAIGDSLGDKFSLIEIIILAVIAGPITGLISYLIITWLIKKTGRVFGGIGEFKEIGIALAWSNVPFLTSFILLVINYLYYGMELFQSNTPKMTQYPYVWFGLSFLELVLIGWSIFLFIKGLAEAQQFSSWRAVANIILSIIVFIGMIILFLLFMVLLRFLFI